MQEPGQGAEKPIIPNKEAFFIRKAVHHLELPEKGLTGEQLAAISFADILDNIEETKQDLAYVTGKANREELRIRLRTLEDIKFRHPQRIQVQDAHDKNYEAFMSFSPEQERVLRDGFSLLSDFYHAGSYGNTERKKSFESVGIHIPSKDLEGKSYFKIPELSRTSNVDVGINDLELKRDVAALVAAYKEKRKGFETSEKTRLADAFAAAYDAAFPEKVKED